MAGAGANAKTNSESLTSSFMRIAFTFSHLQPAALAKTGWQCAQIGLCAVTSIGLRQHYPLEFLLQRCYFSTHPSVAWPRMM